MVVAAVSVEVVALGRRETETGGEGEAVVREVEAAAVGEDVPEVGVHVQESVRVEEVGDGRQSRLHQSAAALRLPGGEPISEPVMQRLRDVLQEQRDARGSRPQRLDASTRPGAAAPVRHGPLHVGQFGREEVLGLGQDPPVVHQREA
ncbi:hypothetical protein GCM10018780_44300 [Streptomyces lanatus]|nr:hypothetical protein GCM10018780_44300 [Streptomyces lanatus]